MGRHQSSPNCTAPFRRVGSIARTWGQSVPQSSAERVFFARHPQWQDRDNMRREVVDRRAVPPVETGLTCCSPTIRRPLSLSTAAIAPTSNRCCSARNPSYVAHRILRGFVHLAVSAALRRGHAAGLARQPQQGKARWPSLCRTPARPSSRSMDSVCIDFLPCCPRRRRRNATCTVTGNSL
jgi:hypothetical protein